MHKVYLQYQSRRFYTFTKTFEAQMSVWGYLIKINMFLIKNLYSERNLSHKNV